MGEKPRLLDAFCGAGGCTRGYQMAGFHVTGVDIAPQPRYVGDAFVQGDAIAYIREHGHEYDAIHASPPCHRYSTVTGTARHGRRGEYPDLVALTRDALVEQGRPYVIENVVNAPLRTVVLLCGSMFGLDVRRHRLFESSWLLFQPGCRHDLQTPRFRSLDHRRNTPASVVGVHGHLNYRGESELRRRAMGINWMTDHELTQAIPPAYTQYIGTQLRRYLETERSAA